MHESQPASWAARVVVVVVVVMVVVVVVVVDAVASRSPPCRS